MNSSCPWIFVSLFKSELMSCMKSHDDKLKFVFLLSEFSIHLLFKIAFCIYTFLLWIKNSSLSSKLYFVCCLAWRPSASQWGSQQQPSFQMKTQKSCWKITSHWRVTSHTWKITSHTNLWVGQVPVSCLSPIVGCFFALIIFWNHGNGRIKYKYEWCNKRRWESWVEKDQRAILIRTV